jgi:signal transduction histidine kinase
MKNEFVSTVSHELRTPLTSIKGALQLLLDEVGPQGDPDHQTLMNVALTNTDRLIRIINDILDISKIEAGKLTLQPRICDVGELVKQFVQSVEQIARASSVELSTFVPPVLPQVNVDPDRTIQAIVNLLSNALKYAPEGSVVQLRTTYELDGRISLAVIDRGKGIPREKLGKLFQKFQQIDGSDSRRFPGTGLGLAITKALVEQQGGSITVASEIDVGTTFTIYLPAIRTELLALDSPGDTAALSFER